MYDWDSLDMTVSWGEDFAELGLSFACGSFPIVLELRSFLLGYCG